MRRGLSSFAPGWLYLTQGYVCFRGSMVGAAEVMPLSEVEAFYTGSSLQVRVRVRVGVRVRVRVEGEGWGEG